MKQVNAMNKKQVNEWTRLSNLETYSCQSQNGLAYTKPMLSPATAPFEKRILSTCSICKHSRWQASGLITRAKSVRKLVRSIYMSESCYEQNKQMHKNSKQLRRKGFEPTHQACLPLISYGPRT